MSDKYKNFNDLKKSEKENCDFKIDYKDIGSKIAIVAPHGGKIEDKTTEIAKLIAGNNCNYYSFIGQKSNNNRDLHITSHKFDEPRALELVGNSEIVIAIHGCMDEQKNEQKKKINYSKKIFIGGLNKDLIDKLQEVLEDASLPISTDQFPGIEPDNICNRATTRVDATGEGVQFELTRSFRDDGILCGKFIAAVSECLKTL